MPTQYDAFLDKQLTARYPVPRSEADALRGLFNGSLTPEQAAQALTANVVGARKEAEAWSALNRVWVLVTDAAAKFPEKADELVALLLAIRDLSPADVTISGTAVIHWPDLPRLSWHWAEVVFDWAPAGHSVRPPPHQSYDAHLNLVRLVARLTGAADDEATDYLARAEDDVAAAFGGASDARGRELEAWVAVAAEWIKGAGGRVRRACVQGAEVPGSRRAEGEKGRRFSERLWIGWKEEAREVSEGKGGVGAATKAVAKEVIEVMDKLEEEE